MDRSKIKIEFATSLQTDPRQAVRELRSQLSDLPSAGLLFFCSSKYDLQALGTSLQETFPGVVVGCTSSGQIGPLGFQLSGIAAAAISSTEMTLSPYLISPLHNCEVRVAEVARQIREDNREASKKRAFGLILADGLSRSEEILTAALYQSLGNVPLFGGSAGDDLVFEKTYVYINGRFINDAAIFVFFETNLPFKILKFQHFLPTEKRLVITSADPQRRIVHEINGETAAIAYAEIVGCSPEELSGKVFSANPLLLTIGDEYFIRAIQKANFDGSLTLFCAIDEGLVLRLGKSAKSVEKLRAALQQVKAALDPALIIGCDCILRRLELEDTGEASLVGALFAENKVLGFSTYGEQYNSIHINQTFTGVAIGS